MLPTVHRQCDRFLRINCLLINFVFIIIHEPIIIDEFCEFQVEIKRIPNFVASFCKTESKEELNMIYTLHQLTIYGISSKLFLDSHNPLSYIALTKLSIRAYLLYVLAYYFIC